MGDYFLSSQSGAQCHPDTFKFSTLHIRKESKPLLDIVVILCVYIENDNFCISLEMLWLQLVLVSKVFVAPKTSFVVSIVTRIYLSMLLAIASIRFLKINVFILKKFEIVA